MPKPYRSRFADNSSGSQALGTHAVAHDGAGDGFASSAGFAANSRPQADNLTAGNQPPRDTGQNNPARNLRTAAPRQLPPANFSDSRARASSTHNTQTLAPLRSQRRDVIVDRSVAPAGYTAPAQSFQNQQRQHFGQSRQDNFGSRRNQASQSRQEDGKPKNGSSSAKALIARFGFDQAQANGQQGDSANLVPLRLADVLNQGQQRANRSQLIDQYWGAFDDWAQSVSAKKHRDWVNGLRVSKSTDQETVGVAKSNAENEVTHSRIQLGKSQAQLKTLLGSASAIVPADLPTVTMVKTNFQAFKERGLIAPRFEGIDQTLVDLHDLVVSRADTVLMAERTAEKVKGYYQSGQTTIEHLLGAGRAWRDAETDFVSSAIEYNKAYAGYALSLPYGRAPVEQVVAMLVTPSSGSQSSIANARQAQPSRTQGQPASFGQSRPVAQNRSANQGQSASQSRPAAPQQEARDSRVRAASNGFGRSRVSQGRTSGPLPDFSDAVDPAAAAASFSSPKKPVFQPNSPTSPARNNLAAPRTSSPSATSFGGGSQRQPPAASFGGGSQGQSSGASFGGASSATSFGSGTSAQPAAASARRQPAAASGRREPPAASARRQPPARSNAIGGFSSGGANGSASIGSPAVQPATSPVSKPAVKPSASLFDSKPPATQGFSGGASGSKPASAAGGGSAFKSPSADAFSKPSARQPGIVKPPAQPVSKPTDHFGESGFGSNKKQPAAKESGGFSAGFGG